MLREKDKATFYSPSEVWSLPASTSTKPEEQFVVDSRASMHMLSRKDLDLAELHTMRVSRKLYNGCHSQQEVKTNVEATENVHGLELFVTVQILEDTLAVLSRKENSSKNTDIHMSGQVVRNHIQPKRQKCNTENTVYRSLSQEFRLLPLRLHIHTPRR